MNLSSRHLPAAPAAVPAVTPPPRKYVNQHGRARGQKNAFPGETAVPLSANEKAHVCILARRAFVAFHGAPPSCERELTTWRRDQQQKAIGQTSLTRALRSDLPALEACFLDMAGQSGRAMTVLLSDDLKDRAQARAVLSRECAAKGLSLAYPEAICRRQYRCLLAEASRNQLWQLVFTVRNRKGGPR